MKKIPFLIVLLTLSSSWYGTAQITTSLYNEDFEAGAGDWIVNKEVNGAWDGDLSPSLLGDQDLPITTFSKDFKYEIGSDTTGPLFISATPQNYTLSEVSIAWFKDGSLIQGETDITLPVSKGGFYEIVVTFIETNISADAVGINVVQLRNFDIPQGISPNGDGKNDTFDLSNFDVQRIEIFNRLGTRVYSKDNYTNEWFGQSENGDELPVGTYFYTLVYDGGAQTKSSWVYINK